MAVIGKVEVVITQIEDTIDIEKAQGCVLGKMREKREVKKKKKKKNAGLKIQLCEYVNYDGGEIHKDI